MALKVLLLRKQLENKRKALDELRGKDEDFAKREAEMEAAIAEITNDQEVGQVQEAIDGFLGAMKEAGKFCRLDEKLIDAGTAVSGCGPAFVCLMAEALADGGVQAGLPRDKALLLAEQTLLGTAKMLLETGVQPGALKDAVCSPGGSTIAGVHALEEGAFRATAADGVLAAYERTQELGK